MPSIQYLLFSILMLLFLGAVIAFIRLVIRPLRIHWAITEARKLLANRDVSNTWRFRNVFRTLASSRSDLEAAELWQKLKEIRESKASQA